MTRHTCEFQPPPRYAHWLAAMLVVMTALDAHAGAPVNCDDPNSEHGGGATKACSNRCVGDTMSCTSTFFNLDGFQDSLLLTDAFDTVDGSIRVPAAGNLPIIAVLGNAVCTGATCNPATGTGCSFPCLACTAGTSDSHGGLTCPSLLQAGAVRVRQNTQVITHTGATPDTVSFIYTDNCDSRCSNCPTTVLTTPAASNTTVPNCADADPCNIDCCAAGVCSHPSTCVGATCRDVNGDVVTFLPLTCADNDVCTTDVCVNDANLATACCENPAIPCQERSCFDLTGCDPILGCQYESECLDPDRCDDRDICTADICSENVLGCCTNTLIACDDAVFCTRDFCQDGSDGECSCPQEQCRHEPRSCLPGEIGCLDCNDNDIADNCDVELGLSGDCDDDLIPDECEADCQLVDEPGHGVPDDCDIAHGTSQDCNETGIPDECEYPQVGTATSEWIAREPSTWSLPPNWCLPEVPQNDGAQFDVRISGESALSRLDISPTVHGIALSGGAILEAGALGPPIGDRITLTVSSAGSGQFSLEDSTIQAIQGRTLVVVSDADVVQSAAATISAQGQGSAVELQNVRVVGGILQGLEGGQIRVRNDTQARLMNVRVEGDVVLDTVVVSPGGIGQLDGAVVNNGTIAVGAPLAVGSSLLKPGQLGATLSGNGRVRLANGDSRLGDPLGALESLAGHTIEGAGVILGAFLNRNGAVVRANHPTDALILSPAGTIGEKTNEGVLLAEAGGWLRIDDLVEQSGTGHIEAGPEGVVEFASGISGTGAFVARGGKLRVLDRPEPVVLEGWRLDAGGASDLLGEIEVEPGTTIRLSGLARIGPGGSYHAAASPGGDAVFEVGSLTVHGGSSPNSAAGRVELTGSMRLVVRQDLVLDGFYALPCDTLGPSYDVALGGHTPPIKNVRDQASVAVAGDYSMAGSVDITYDSSEPLLLKGDFDNQSRVPACFHWEQGGIVLEGSSEQLFEVAGRDFGAVERGFVSNFAMRTVEIATGATVRFLNRFVNQADGLSDSDRYSLEDYLGFHGCLLASGPDEPPLSNQCRRSFDDDEDGDVDLYDLRAFQLRFGIGPEALYINRLVLQQGSLIIVSDVTIYSHEIVDQGASTILLGTGALVPF